MSVILPNRIYFILPDFGAIFKMPHKGLPTINCERPLFFCSLQLKKFRESYLAKVIAVFDKQPY